MSSQETYTQAEVDAKLQGHTHRDTPVCMCCRCRFNEELSAKYSWEDRAQEVERALEEAKKSEHGYAVKWADAEERLRAAEKSLESFRAGAQVEAAEADKLRAKLTALRALLKSEAERLRRNNCECGGEASDSDHSYEEVTCYGHEVIEKIAALLKVDSPVAPT